MGRYLNAIDLAARLEHNNGREDRTLKRAAVIGFG
jgi:hypothetical protein